MALLAETIVEEFYNYNGFFTMRGVKAGLGELDLLAVKLTNKAKKEACHIEVQVSQNPVGYISQLTKDVQAELNTPYSTSASMRTEEQLKLCVKEWCRKKYFHPKKDTLRKRLYPRANWEYVFVHGNVTHKKELELIKSEGIEVIDIRLIIQNLMQEYRKRTRTSGVGRDIINLFKLFDLVFDEEEAIRNDQTS